MIFLLLRLGLELGITSLEDELSVPSCDKVCLGLFFILRGVLRADLGPLLNSGLSKE